jgi:hypothetical protein
MDPAFKPAEPSQDLRVTPRVVLGLGVMLAGLVLALDSLGLVDGGALFRFWPLAIVAVGIVKWLSPAPQRMSALIWIVAGVALLLVTMGHMSFAGVWAVILFLLGARSTCGTRRCPRDARRCSTPSRSGVGSRSASPTTGRW